MKTNEVIELKTIGGNQLEIYKNKWKTLPKKL
jgi:hypothetical protein